MDTNKQDYKMNVIKKLLLAYFSLTCVLAQEASPYTVTVGCFIDNFASSLVTCSNIDIQCSFNQLDYSNYGFTTARLCERYGAALGSYITEQNRANANATIANNNLAAFNSCKQEKDSCTASLNVSSGNSLAYLITLTKQKQLVSKLRKVCGSK